METGTLEYHGPDAKAYFMEQFVEQGDFLELFSKEILEGMIQQIMALDEAYLHESGADAGAIYDDDDAYEYMYKALCQAYPEHKMYMMRFVEDYMEYNDQYLESAGAIEWE